MDFYEHHSWFPVPVDINIQLRYAYDQGDSIFRTRRCGTLLTYHLDSNDLTRDDNSRTKLRRNVKKVGLHCILCIVFNIPTTHVCMNFFVLPDWFDESVKRTWCFRLDLIFVGNVNYEYAFCIWRIHIRVQNLQSLSAYAYLILYTVHRTVDCCFISAAKKHVRCLWKTLYCKFNSKNDA